MFNDFLMDAATDSLPRKLLLPKKKFLPSRKQVKTSSWRLSLCFLLSFDVRYSQLIKGKQYRNMYSFFVGLSFQFRGGKSQRLPLPKGVYNVPVARVDVELPSNNSRYRAVLQAIWRSNHSYAPSCHFHRPIAFRVGRRYPLAYRVATEQTI